MVTNQNKNQHKGCQYADSSKVLQVCSTIEKNPNHFKENKNHLKKT